MGSRLKQQITATSGLLELYPRGPFIDIYLSVAVLKNTPQNLKSILIIVSYTSLVTPSETWPFLWLISN